MTLLAESSKWKPYLREVPAIQQLPKEHRLIAQELGAALSFNDKQIAGRSLAGIFLVLPELAKTEPAWLEALQRVQVTPRSQDITILIKSLQSAKVGDIFKVGKGASAVPVKIDSSDPNAVPIFTAGMKKKFENLCDEWSAYVGTANAEIGRGVLSLPPIRVIYRFAYTGMENLGLPEEEIANGISAHSIWPFITGALHYQGTKGPCFFLVRVLKHNEIGQLKALLKQTTAHSRVLENALRDYEPLLVAAANREPIASSSSLGKSLGT